MALLRLHLFGPPRLTRGGKSVDISLRKALALFVYLAVTRQPHSRDTLATLFWPEDGQREARANLRRTIYRLNAALDEGVLTVMPEVVSLNPAADLWIDIEAYEEGIRDALAGRLVADTGGESALAQLVEAAKLYTNDFLAGFTLPDCPGFDDWQFFQREGLLDSFGQVLAQLVDVYHRRSEYDSAILYARRWLALDPLHEPAHRQLMQLYALAGQQAAALRQYQECERVLAAEFDAPPEEETRKLYEAIRARRFPGDRPEQKPAPMRSRDPEASKPADPHKPASPRFSGRKLPQPTMPFVGRSEELALLLQQLHEPDCRLLTLVGPGGVGKTRLAIEAAQRILSSSTALSSSLESASESPKFTDGVCFSPLVSVSDPADMPFAIAEALGLHVYDNIPLTQQLLTYLQPRRMLLILDNIEHLLSEMDLLLAILAAAPGVTLLVTSREALNLQEEWFHAVGGLSYPAVDDRPDRPLDAAEGGAAAQYHAAEGGAAAQYLEAYDALRFFAQCARRANEGFSLAAEATNALRICQYVEGMPLALELAATWLKVLTTEEVADELARNLDILTSRHRNAPARHRSMSAVLDQTWAMLDAEEQRAMVRLSVFQGGFSRQAAQRVANTSLSLLSSLLSKALLRRNQGERYSIHQLLRQYAAQHLRATPGEEAQARERHCQYYGAFLQSHQNMLKGEKQVEALDEIAMEIENIRSGWYWALDQIQHDFEKAILVDRYVDALFHFFDTRSLFQAGEEMFRLAARPLQARLDDALTGEAVSSRQQILAGRILARLGWFTFHLGRWLEARALLQQSVDHLLAAKGRVDAAFALNYLGAVCRYMGDFGAARQNLDASMALCRATGDQYGLSVALNILGQVAYLQEDYTLAERFCQQSLEIKQAIGDRWGTVFSLTYLGAVARMQGYYTEAKRLYDESMAISMAIGDRRGVAMALYNLGELAELGGRLEEAGATYQQSLAIYREIHNLLGMISVHTRLANLAHRNGDAQTALRHLHAALQISSDLPVSSQILETVTSVAVLWQRLGRRDAAKQLLDAVVQHPACDGKTRAQALSLLAETVQVSEEPAPLVTSIAQTTAGKTLEALLAQILAPGFPLSSA